MKRIDKTFKKQFLKTFTRDFKQAYKDNEIDESLFLPNELKSLHLVVKNPNKYYRKFLNSPSLIEKLFSIKKEDSKKIIKIFGIKFKVKN